MTQFLAKTQFLRMFNLLPVLKCLVGGLLLALCTHWQIKRIACSQSTCGLTTYRINQELKTEECDKQDQFRSMGAYQKDT